MIDLAESKATTNNFLDGLRNSKPAVISFFIVKWQFGISVAFMDLFIYNGNNFHINGKLDIKGYQKTEKKYVYIPFKSTLPRHTINSYIF